MAPGYRSRLQDELARKTGIRSGSSRQVELEAHVLDTAARTSASVLCISDIAETVADALKNQRHEILEHVGRVLKLIEAKSGDVLHQKSRVDKLYRRVMQLESECGN
jgi:hypothetical protein